MSSGYFSHNHSGLHRCNTTEHRRVTADIPGREWAKECSEHFLRVYGYISCDSGRLGTVGRAYHY